MSSSRKTALRHIMNTVYALMIVVIGVWQLSNQLIVSGGSSMNRTNAGSSPAAELLKQLPVKGRAAKTGYSRSNFSNGWGNTPACDVRNAILARDLLQVTYVDTSCKVQSGVLQDPYTGKQIHFVRGVGTSDDVQIDHVVALGDAWQKGAQQLSAHERYMLANDPLELLAVDGQANQDKGDSDAASWLPPNKNSRCAYVARQIAVKHAYHLWVTEAEYNAIASVLSSCPEQTIPSGSF